MKKLSHRTLAAVAARIRSGAVRSARELREALREALGPDDEGVPL